MLKKINSLKIEIEFRKLITEYNAILISMISLILGITVFAYNVSKDLFSSLVITLYVFIFINIIRGGKEKEINDKIKELV